MVRKTSFALLILTLTFLFGACGESGGVQENTIDTGFEAATAGNYDSEDTAVVIKTDSDAMTITLLNLELGKQYTLNYDGTTSFTDKYNVALSVSQIKTGDIVDVQFMHSRKRLANLKISESAWYYEGVSKYTINDDASSISIGTDIYQLNTDLVVASDVQLITLSDIIQAKDVITVAGIDRTIYSIMIETGHGYVSLLNDDSFIGGWIEIGTSIVPITEGMLLTITEGSYDALVSYSGTNATIPITVIRNEEIEIDLGEIAMAASSNGMVIFNITPSDATVYIDSVEMDVTNPISLSSGIHQIILNADGYASTTKYIKVGTVTSTLDFAMESLDDSTSETEDSDDSDSSSEDDKEDTSETSTDSTTTAQTNTSSENDTQSESGYVVSIESPEETEVYVDGTYIGITPVSFQKKAGDYVITLRKTGYQTRSYSVTVDSEEKDSILTFADLSQL